MNTLNRFVLLALCAIAMGACRNYANVPSSDIGLILTPTGYEKHIYTSGQVNIGDSDTNGRGNVLILIQSSGFEAYEQFMGKEASPDKQDHRCQTKNGEQVILDVREVFALPNWNTEKGRDDLEILVGLGTPQAVDAEPKGRVQRIDLKSMYDLRARMAIRNLVRETVSQYTDYKAVFAAFSDGTLNKKIKTLSAKALADGKIPLGLIDAAVSNVKPDEAVVQASSSRQSTSTLLENITEIETFLKEDKTGLRLFIYKTQVMQTLVSAANANGHNTVVVALPEIPKTVSIPLR